MPARIEAGWAHCDLGRIPVNNHRNNSAAQIMLRPEQLQLASVLPSDPDGTGCRAVVTDRDFSGNTCTLTVELQSLTPRDQPGRSLLVRSSGMYAPPAGSAVQVSTIGHAHVLSEL
jgi:iron(III) transport system ATP-binding protein